jgi:hypothetical protein
MIDYDDPDFDSLEVEYATMYSLVGYFIAQYSLVEFGITFLLAAVCRTNDPEAFHTLTKGMDAKTKIQRLRQLSRQQKRPSLGNKLDARLVFLHDKVAEIRNNLSHSALFKSPDDPQRIIFSGIGRLPLQTFGYAGTSPSLQEVSFLALEAYGDWLNALQGDIVKLLKKVEKQTKVFEIARPRSEEPGAFQKYLIDQDAQAKVHTHDGKPRLKSK